MRLDEQTHHCEVLNTLSEYQNSRSGRNRVKEDVLTWGGLRNHVFDKAEKSAEVVVPTGNEVQKTVQVSQLGKD